MKIALFIAAGLVFAGIGAADSQTAAPPTTRAAPPAVQATRTPHQAPKPGQTLILDIKELGNFEFDPEIGGDIPDDVRKLDGVKFRTHGFMVPIDQAENITQFALVPSLLICCLGKPPQIQHTIVVTVTPGKTVDYCPDEVTVEGTLKVQEKTDEGYVVQIFAMEATSVRPSPK